MLTARARIETERSSRYLVQLCRHADEMGRHPRPRAHRDGDTPPRVRHVEWSPTRGSVSFDIGQCALSASGDALSLRAEAANEEDLRRLQTLLAQRLETIGRRDHLVVTWQQIDAPSASLDEPVAAAPAAAARAGAGITHPGRGRHRIAVLVAVVALVLAVHLALVAGVLTSPWAGWAADILAIVVVGKIVAVTLIGLRHRRARTRRQRGSDTSRPGSPGGRPRP